MDYSSVADNTGQSSFI